jgi:hypothetical protein
LKIRREKKAPPPQRERLSIKSVEEECFLAQEGREKTGAEKREQNPVRRKEGGFKNFPETPLKALSSQ